MTKLFVEYARLLKGLQPKAFIVENVTGMIKGAMKQTFLDAIKLLRECGYKAKGEVLNSMYYGVPQARCRVIIIGIRNDLKINPTHPKPQTKPMSVDEALRNVKAETFLTLKPEWHSTKLWRRMRPGQTGADVNEKPTTAFSLLKINRFKPCPTIPKTLLCNNRLYGAPCHWSEPRTLSIEEIKRLSSFPDDFKLTGSIVDQWARIGNSVPPLLMKAVAIHLKELLTSFPNKGKDAKKKKSSK